MKPHTWLDNGRKDKSDSTTIEIRQRWHCTACGIDAQMVVTSPRVGRGETQTRWRWRTVKGGTWYEGTPEGAGHYCF